MRIGYLVTTLNVQLIFDLVAQRVLLPLSLSACAGGDAIIAVEEEFEEYEDSKDVRKHLSEVLEERMSDRDFQLLLKEGNEGWCMVDEFIAEDQRKKKQLREQVANLKSEVDQLRAVRAQGSLNDRWQDSPAPAFLLTHTFKTGIFK